MRIGQLALSPRNHAPHIVQRNWFPMIRKRSEQPGKRADGYDAHFIVFQNRIAYPITGLYAERFADGLRQGSLPS